MRVGLLSLALWQLLSFNGFQHSDLDNASLDLVALFLIKAKKKLTPLAQGRLCLKQQKRTNLHAISYNSALQSFQRAIVLQHDGHRTFDFGAHPTADTFRVIVDQTPSRELKSPLRNNDDDPVDCDLVVVDSEAVRPETCSMQNEDLSQVLVF